jgi:hypothetical protein
MSCEECGIQLYDTKTYKVHKLKMHGKQVSCPVCSKVSKSQFTLEKHMKTHSNEVHVCEICSLELRSAEYLKNHIKRMHQDQPIPRFPCKFCSFKGAKSEETLDKHILKNHSGAQHLCSECPKSFGNEEKRKIHEENMHGEKSIKCEFCDQMFSNNRYRKAHVKQVHEKKKDRICPHCGEAFFQPESFKAHVLRHTDDRQFPCDMCGKAFLMDRDLQNHIKFHTKPYKCDQCEKSFGSKGFLNDHVKMKHDGLKHECRFRCGHEAWFRTQVNIHEKACRLNPVPGAPYSVAVGTASSLTLERYHEKLKESPFKHNE